MLQTKSFFSLFFIRFFFVVVVRNHFFHGLFSTFLLFFPFMSGFPPWFTIIIHPHIQHIHTTGVINRGDSFRRKRSRSNSLANSPMSPNQSPSVSNPTRSFGPVDSYRVNMLGGPGVGKTALISQFCTSECINAYEDTGLYKHTKTTETQNNRKNIVIFSTLYLWQNRRLNKIYRWFWMALNRN